MVTRPRTTWFHLARHEDPPADPPTDPQGATPPADPTPDPVPDEPLGDAGKRALEAERKARREAEARAKSNEEAAAKLKEIEDAQKDEKQRLEEAKTAAETAADEARTEVLRLRVMATEGLDAELEEFLTAKDEDGLKAQAAKLKERLAAQAPRVPAPDPGQGAGKTPPGEVDMRTATKEERDAALRKLGVRSF